MHSLSTVKRAKKIVCALLKNVKTNIFPYVFETEKDIEKIFADLKSLESNHVVVNFFQKRKLLIFSRYDRVHLVLCVF